VLCTQVGQQTKLFPLLLSPSYKRTMPMALSLSLLLDVLFIRFQSSDIDTSIAAFLVLTGLPSGRRWSVRVSNNKRIEIVKKQKGVLRLFIPYS
jgi:hypothetical protein